jgi:UDP-N-acetylglucosamine--N-acetylmuramyl-(pentapeptide) pyrophosphoryl-undecaprenol N-acetylglucosamine transferase
MPFYENMAGLWQRANLAISRAGAGTLSELAIAATPAVLIPYPYAAEDHQAFNAAVFAKAGAATVYRQGDLTAEQLEQTILHLLENPLILKEMAAKAFSLAVPDSTERCAQLMRAELTRKP